MATLFNNTEITNVFFNGTELDKIYFNGVLVFEKQQLYFRRVIVGDIFEKGKKMKSDFYSGFYNDFSALPEYNDNVLYSLFTFAPGVMSGIEVTPADTFEIDNNYLVNSDDILIYSYNTKTGEEFYNNGPYAIVVNSITNTSIPTDTYSIAPRAVLYRHFYIEDENIRPLKVGDILDIGTKLYFTIPDNINLDFNNLGNYYFGYVIRVGDSDGFPAGIWMFVKDGRAASNEYQISIQTEYWDTELVEIYSYNTDNNTVNTNISEYTLTQYLGVVESTPETSSGSTSSEEIEEKLFNNIFVDITTLGV